MNKSKKKQYVYRNRIQAVVKKIVQTGIAEDVAQTGESASAIAARILEDHYKKKKAGK